MASGQGKEPRGKVDTVVGEHRGSACRQFSRISLRDAFREGVLTETWVLKKWLIFKLLLFSPCNVHWECAPLERNPEGRDVVQNTWISILCGFDTK